MTAAAFLAVDDVESQAATQRLVPQQQAPPPTMDYPADGGCVPCCCYRRRIGNVYVLWEKKPSAAAAAEGALPTIRCLAPVCWPMIFVSLGIISTASLLVFRFTLPQLPTWVGVGSVSILGVFATALLLTSLRDFGIFPRHHGPLGPNWNWSLQSQSFRPPGVVFCSESKVSVVPACMHARVRRAH